jgi:beta-galactosidase
VRVRHGVNRMGKTIHYYLNYSSQTREFNYAYRDGTELLGNRPLKNGAAIKLGAWDVAIVEE